LKCTIYFTHEQLQEHRMMILRIRSHIEYLLSTCNTFTLLLHSNLTRKNLVLLAGFDTIYFHHSAAAYVMGPPCTS